MINAYKKTNYEVFFRTAFTLNIDIFSERLSSIYKENSVETACFITAYNPFSEKLTLEDNKAFQENFYKISFTLEINSLRELVSTLKVSGRVNQVF